MTISIRSSTPPCPKRRTWATRPYVINSAAMILFFVIAPKQNCLGIEKTDSQKHFNDIKKYVQDGQFNLVEDTAKSWAAIQDADLDLMSESCALLINEKQHAAAVILLKRLDWIMPKNCHYIKTLHYMKAQGLTKEIDRVLTYGTSLTAREDTRQISLDYVRHGTVVTHHNALALFSFYARDRVLTEKLFYRYGREVMHRPDDVRLITEYALLLARFSHIEETLEVLNQIDISKLDPKTLVDLGNFCSPLHGDIRLVRFSIIPLERSLTLVLNGEEAFAEYRGPRQINASISKALFHARLLLNLARRYVRLERYADAKNKYESYIEFPIGDFLGSRIPEKLEYVEVLTKLGLPDTIRGKLELRANTTNQGKDWANFASYLQGLGEIDKAKIAWKKAISLTPARPDTGKKMSHPRRWYQKQLTKLLNDSKMQEEIDTMKANENN